MSELSEHRPTSDTNPNQEAYRHLFKANYAEANDYQLPEINHEQAQTITLYLDQSRDNLRASFLSQLIPTDPVMTTSAALQKFNQPRWAQEAVLAAIHNPGQPLWSRVASLATAGAFGMINAGNQWRQRKVQLDQDNRQ